MGCRHAGLGAQRLFLDICLNFYEGSLEEQENGFVLVVGGKGQT